MLKAIIVCYASRTKLFEEQNLQPDRNLFMSIMQRIERHSRPETVDILNQLDEAGVLLFMAINGSLLISRITNCINR